PRAAPTPVQPNLTQQPQPQSQSSTTQAQTPQTQPPATLPQATTQAAQYQTAVNAATVGQLQQQQGVHMFPGTNFTMPPETFAEIEKQVEIYRTTHTNVGIVDINAFRSGLEQKALSQLLIAHQAARQQQQQQYSQLQQQQQQQQALQLGGSSSVATSDAAVNGISGIPGNPGVLTAAQQQQLQQLNGGRPGAVQPDAKFTRLLTSLPGSTVAAAAAAAAPGVANAAVAAPVAMAPATLTPQQHHILVSTLNAGQIQFIYERVRSQLQGASVVQFQQQLQSGQFQYSPLINQLLSMLFNQQIQVQAQQPTQQQLLHLQLQQQQQQQAQAQAQQAQRLQQLQQLQLQQPQLGVSGPGARPVFNPAQGLLQSGLTMQQIQAIHQQQLFQQQQQQQQISAATAASQQASATPGVRPPTNPIMSPPPQSQQAQSATATPTQQQQPTRGVKRKGTTGSPAPTSKSPRMMSPKATKVARPGSVVSNARASATPVVANAELPAATSATAAAASAAAATATAAVLVPVAPDVVQVKAEPGVEGSGTAATTSYNLRANGSEARAGGINWVS
ncbi:hypothetical protein FBU59_000729, partial [Linderina macrospora]